MKLTDSTSAAMGVVRAASAHAIAAALGLALSVSAVVHLILPDRGIDLTDEMMYLLAATSDSESFIHSPWGWHTAPLLRLAGDDVARFRIVGVLFLAAASATLALFARHINGAHSESRLRSPLAIMESAFLAAGATFWSSLFYIGMLRSPGHNWVTVLGLSLAASGILALQSPDRIARVWLGPFLVGLGAIGAFPARPLAVVPVALAAFVLAVSRRGSEKARIVVARLLALPLAGVGILILLRVWPASATAVLTRALQAPALVERSGVVGALRSYLLFPADWAGGALSLLAANRLTAWAVFLLLVVGVVGFSRPKAAPTGVRTCWRFAIAQAPIASLVAVMGLLSLRPTLGGLGYGSQLRGIVAIGSVAFAALIALLVDRNAASARRALLPGLLVLLAAASGLGTAGSLVGLSTNGFGLIAVALLLLTWGSGERRVGTRIATSAIWSVGGAVAAGLLLTAGTSEPYRMQPLDDQSHRVSVLEGEILVDEVTALRIRELRHIAMGSGYAPGDRLITLTLPWSSFPPVVLQSTYMPSLVPAVFGYPGTKAMAEFNFGLLGGGWTDAWVIVDRVRDSDVYRSRGHQLLAAEASVALATGRSFPDGYVCVAEGNFYQLWLPADLGSGACDYASPVPRDD